MRDTCLPFCPYITNLYLLTLSKKCLYLNSSSPICHFISLNQFRISRSVNLWWWWFMMILKHDDDHVFQHSNIALHTFSWDKINHILATPANLIGGNWVRLKYWEEKGHIMENYCSFSSQSLSLKNYFLMSLNNYYNIIIIIEWHQDFHTLSKSETWFWMGQ